MLLTHLVKEQVCENCPFSASLRNPRIFPVIMLLLNRKNSRFLAFLSTLEENNGENVPKDVPGFKKHRAFPYNLSMRVQ